VFQASSAVEHIASVCQCLPLPKLGEDFAVCCSQR